MEGFKNPRLENRNRVSSECRRDVRVLTSNILSCPTNQTIERRPPIVPLNDRAIVDGFLTRSRTEFQTKWHYATATEREDNTGREGKVDSLRVATSAENAAQSAFIKC